MSNRVEGSLFDQTLLPAGRPGWATPVSLAVHAGTARIAPVRIPRPAVMLADGPGGRNPRRGGRARSAVVGGQVQEAMLIERVQPVYPPLARQTRIEGRVEFPPVISHEGAIANLQLLSGHPLLAGAARDATSLHAQPVEVITQDQCGFHPLAVAWKEMGFSDSFFAQKFGITTQNLESYLSEALSQGGDYADLYFESVASTSLSIDEGIVKSASQGVSLGVGVRVISGEKTGYAYSADLAPEKIRHAARTAACIAAGPSKVLKTGIEEGERRNLYPVLTPASDTSLAERVELIKRADRAARAYDARIFQVRANFVDNVRHVLVATSDGVLNFDKQPMARLNVSVLAREGDGSPQEGFSGGGGRIGIEAFLTDKTPERYATEAARQAIGQLSAAEAPAGEMTVVLGPGWPGVLLHEAVGHGLEADFNRKGVSAFSDRIGQKVASELCTVIDNGTIADRRGSLNMDDEGNVTRENVLIEKGILRGYLQDKLSSRLTGATATGSGRRESYQHVPMPRMTNTYMLAGESDPADIIRSVPKGLYCVNFAGGQVDITSGNFVFSASESYLIEDGKITRPVRGATLIGNGPESMKHVSMVGNDLKLDEGIGICGKEGQSVPVGVGIPTIRVDRMTVGGTA